VLGALLCWQQALPALGEAQTLSALLLSSKSVTDCINVFKKCKRKQWPYHVLSSPNEFTQYPGQFKLHEFALNPKP
jgi:hypothetical protein